MKILVVGASIAGMATALALEGPDREVVLIERDPPPPDMAMDDVFDTWQRKGVAQLRHAHGYPSRFFKIVRDRHPELLKALIEAGARESRFAEMLSESALQRYVPAPGDEDMSVLLSRRTTLEFVMRAYTGNRPGVTFMTDARVTGLVAEKDSDGALVARAVQILRTDETREEIRADMIVDASGRGSLFPDFLARYGITPQVEESQVGVVYFTRFYRLPPGESLVWSPDVAGFETDFLLGGIVPSDKNSFAVMFMVPLSETVLRQRILHPEVFDRICAAAPAISKWTNRAQPMNKPLGMGDLKNRWQQWVKNGAPQIKNLFAVGDSWIRTNPAFGRGCSFALVQADILAEVLRTTDDANARAVLYERRVKAALRPYFKQISSQDLEIIERAKHAHEPGYRPNWRVRLRNSFAQDAIMPAMRGDPIVRRALLRAMHMLDSPTSWLMRPGVVSRVLLTWMKPRSAKSYLPPIALSHEQLMALVKA